MGRLSFGGRSTTIGPYRGWMVDLVSLASENNILSILPSAYYWVLEQHSLGSLFDGIPRPDGTVASLSSLDLRRCVVAREKLLSKQFQQGYTVGWVRWESEFSDNCTNSVQCRRQRGLILTAFLAIRSDNVAFRILCSTIALCECDFVLLAHQTLPRAIHAKVKLAKAPIRNTISGTSLASPPPMSSPLAKRQRTENASIKRSERWLDDGNVVLQAGNTQFRVHWSILALHSSVFRDMQGLPQPPDQPTVDDCPIVELSGDDPEDVEHILKALYIPKFHCQTTLPLAVVGAFIRLGRKYDFKDLLDSAVARIMSEFPATLKEYDTLIQLGGCMTIDRHRGWTIDSISLASENNILSALPCAYYRALNQNGLGTLFDGIPRNDGTLASLSSPDLRKCVVAREKLLSKQMQEGYTFGWTREASGDCTELELCRLARERLPRAFSDKPFLDAFSTASPDCLAPEYKLCRACTRHAIESMAAGRRKMWEELPAIFDLPPWGELKNDI
ncbi:BTB domain-containing protein [Mycena sanguinolenta]|uniref:BTB domain-containing protein n=1 Tax=Mycena sanguinolenta TaxID=230812 RepID=A0A8H7DCG7_9AGAR|nr:BTB domain-containing protein [Mycena sanguinolenta]